MTIIILILMLIVAAVIVQGVRLAFAGDWKNLVILVVALVLVMWILSAFGLTLPSF